MFIYQYPTQISECWFFDKIMVPLKHLETESPSTDWDEFHFLK